MSTKSITSSEIQTIPREIELLQKACEFLAQCQNLDEIKKIRDWAESLRIYCRQQRDSQQAQNHATAVKIRAEQRIGQLTRDMEKSKGGRPGKTPVTVNGVSKDKMLSAAGISQSTASRCEAIAAVPQEEFEKEIDKALKTKNLNKELSSRQMQKLGRRHQRVKEREDRAARAKEELLARGIGVGVKLTPAEIAAAADRQEKGRQAGLAFNGLVKVFQQAKDAGQKFDAVIAMSEAYRERSHALADAKSWDTRYKILQRSINTLLAKLLASRESRPHRLVVVRNGKAYVIKPGLSYQQWNEVFLVTL